MSSNLIWFESISPITQSQGAPHGQRWIPGHGETEKGYDVSWSW
jgi:hypothetical protein